MTDAQKTILMPTGAAADYLTLSRRTLETWRVRGCGPRFRKIGNAVRYALDDLQAFVDAGTRNSTSDTGCR